MDEILVKQYLPIFLDENNGQGIRELIKMKNIEKLKKVYDLFGRLKNNYEDIRKVFKDIIT